jgi:hypothetical protein
MEREGERGERGEGERDRRACESVRPEKKNLEN